MYRNGAKYDSPVGPVRTGPHMKCALSSDRALRRRDCCMHARVEAAPLDAWCCLQIGVLNGTYLICQKEERMSAGRHKKESASTNESVCAGPKSESDTIVPMQPQHRGRARRWNPHAGMKPLRLDDFVSDGELELEDELLFEGAIEEDDPMVKMMANLGDDGEWLPWREQMKKDARIIGKIVHYQARILGLLTNVKGNGSPITMGPTSLQNRHERSDAHNTFGQGRINRNSPLLGSKSHLANPYHPHHPHLRRGWCLWMRQGCHSRDHLVSCRPRHLQRLHPYHPRTHLWAPLSCHLL